MMMFWRARRVMTLASTLLAGCVDTSHKILLASDDSPRDTAMVSAVLSCATCTLAVTDSVVLGTPADSLVPIRGIEFARDSRGNHYVFSDGTQFPILHYDSTGHYRGSLGKLGEGPGEYRMVSKVAIGPGDSLFLIEPAGIVIHVFAPNGVFVRRITLSQSAWVSEVARGGPAVLYGRPVVEGGQSIETKLLRLRGNAQVLDSIALFAPPSGTQVTVNTVIDDGTKRDPIKMDLPLESNVFPVRDGSFWMVSDGNYRLEQYDATGTPRKLFGVHIAGEPAPVMTVAEAKAAVSSGRKIDPWGGVHSKKTKYQFQLHRWVDVDANGLLWVTRQVAATSWDTVAYREIKTTSEFGPESMIPPDIEDRLSHSVLEIIDPKNGRMLARHTFPFRASRVGPGFVGRVATNAEGFLVPIVYRVRLQR